MKKILQSNIIWLVVSLVLSVTLWLYVTGLESDQYTRTFRGVEVELIGEPTLREKGMSVTDISTNTINVEVTGPRRTVAALSSYDLKAQITVSTLTQPSVASMQYSIKYPDGIDTSNITTIRKIPETITFTVSNMVTKTIPVKGSFDGSTAEGYLAEGVSFEPESLVISGPENYISKINCAWVSFGKENVSSTYTEETDFIFIDDDKNQIESKYITCSTEKIVAKQPIKSIKTIPLVVNFVYSAGANELNTSYDIEPAQIRLAGEKSILDGNDKIVLATIDLSTFETTFENSYPIVYDDTLKNVDGIDSAKVSIKIKGLSTKSFKVNNISYTNVTEGYDVSIITKSIDVVLRGEKDNLDKVKEEHIRAVVDLKDYDYSTGVLSVQPNIFVDDTEGFSVGAISNNTVSIEVRRN